VTVSHLRIATRASKLAKWQASWVAEQLVQRGAARVELVEIESSGDLRQEGPIIALGTQGVFTKEIQAAVLDGRADVAVHSLKDLPTQQTVGLILAAVTARHNCADALVSTHGNSLENLPQQARVGTGSLRRQAQLRHLRPDLQVMGIRGNVDTRLRKLDEGQYDAIVLACAGLERLGLEDRIVEELGPPRLLPAPGQGALGIECRADDSRVSELLKSLEHRETRASTDAERAMLGLLHAGCSAPVGAWGRVEADQLILDGLVASSDGQQILRASSAGALVDAHQIGHSVAEDLLHQGAAEIIASARAEAE